jgi:hypothetical protein
MPAPPDAGQTRRNAAARRVALTAVPAAREPVTADGDELVGSIRNDAAVIAGELADAASVLDTLEGLLGDARGRLAEQRITLDELRAAVSSPTQGGTMTVPALARLLSEAEVAYELLPHARTMRAADEAAVLHLAPADVAKTVVLVTADKRVRAVIPASRRLDLEKVRAALGHGAAVLASEQRLSID